MTNRPLPMRRRSLRRTRSSRRPLLEPLEPRSLLTTFTVTTTADEVAVDPAAGTGLAADGQVSLRSAIQAANANPGADTINVPAGTYTLTIAGANEDAAATGDLDITGDLTITGAGADTTIIDGGGLDNVFQAIGAIAANFSGLTIRNAGSGKDLFAGNDAIVADQAAIDVTSCTFTNNPGAGVLTKSGAITVAGSTFSGTGTTGVDLGTESGSIAATNCTFSDITTNINQVGSSKAAVPVNVSGCTFNGGFGIDTGGDVTADHCTFRDAVYGINTGENVTATASSFHGFTDSNGGITAQGINAGPNGTTVTVTGCTFSGPISSDINTGGSVTATGSTFRDFDTAIQADQDVGATGCTFIGHGSPNFIDAGIDTADTGNETVTNCTFSGIHFAIENSSGLATLSFVTIADGAVGVFGGRVAVGNSILADTQMNFQAGPITSLGHNISSDGSGASALTQPGDRNNTDPKLGPLADNGRPTLTYALLPGSPAIDAADSNGGPATDQRGVARPQGASDDIGAFELQQAAAGTPDLVVSGHTDGSLTVGQTETFTVTVTNKGTAAATGLTLSDTLPAGATLVSATGGVAPVNGVLTFAIGNLAAGADTSVVVVVTPTAAGLLSDVAGVRMDQADPNPADNTLTLSATVATPAATPGPTPTPTPSPSPGGGSNPTIQSVHRFGFHSLPTRFVLTFDRPLDAARAQDLLSYRLVDLTDASRPIRLRSAVYQPGDRSVTLRPIKRLDLYDRYRLTVTGTRAMAVDAAAGSPGDAGPTGGDFATTITPANLVLTPAQRRDGSLMARIWTLAATFPGLAHLVGGHSPRPGT